MIIPLKVNHMSKKQQSRVKDAFCQFLVLLTLLCPIFIAADNSPYIYKVYQFLPAPGQFVNVYPEYEDGDDTDDIIAKVEEQLCGDQKPGLISLGGYGGYVVFGFDHSVVNVSGDYDFKIYGNAFSGSSEPGIVEVSVDENGNGLPDDTWYELAGSEYSNSNTILGYQIVYTRPDEDKEMDPDPDYAYVNDRTYVPWSDNQGNTGYVMRNIYHSQSYWPQWLDDTSLEFSGSRLPDNYTLNGSIYTLAAYDWGYVDNQPNSTDEGFNIDWAVDSLGNTVALSSIDFIKVYTALNQYCGWIGETSTEVCGAEDLHPDESGIALTYLDSAEAVIATCRNGILSITTGNNFTAQLYSVSGSTIAIFEVVQGTNTFDISVLPNGLYILATPTSSHKILR